MALQLFAALVLVALLSTAPTRATVTCRDPTLGQRAYVRMCVLYVCVLYVCVLYVCVLYVCVLGGGRERVLIHSLAASLTLTHSLTHTHTLSLSHTHSLLVF